VSSGVTPAPRRRLALLVPPALWPRFAQKA
jgi:hypothetical protein